MLFIIPFLQMGNISHGYKLHTCSSMRFHCLAVGSSIGASILFDDGCFCVVFIVRGFDRVMQDTVVIAIILPLNT